MSSNRLTILAAGTIVRGDVYTQDTLVVEGGVQGHVVAPRVVVKSTGWIQGSLACRCLSIEPGGVVDARVAVVEQGVRLRRALGEAGKFPGGATRALLRDAPCQEEEA